MSYHRHSIYCEWQSFRIDIGSRYDGTGCKVIFPDIICIVCYGWWIIEWIYRDHDRIVYADGRQWSTRIANRYNDGIVTVVVCCRCIGIRSCRIDRDSSVVRS